MSGASVALSDGSNTRKPDSAVWGADLKVEEMKSG